MLRKSLFVCLVLAACSLVSSRNARVGDEFDLARTLLSALNITATAEIDQSRQLFNLLSEETSALGHETMTNTYSAIQDMSIIFNDEVIELRRNAAELGINPDLLQECVEFYDNELLYLYNAVRADVNRCVSGSLIQSVQMINASLARLDSDANVVPYLDLSIRQCELTGDLECIGEVIEVIEIQLIDLPAKVREDTIRTTAVVDALEATFDDCLSDRIDSVNILGNGIINSLKACVGMLTQ